MLKVLLSRTALSLSLIGFAALPAACDETPDTSAGKAAKPAAQAAKKPGAGVQKGASTAKKPPQIAEDKKKPADASKKMVGRVTLEEALSDKVLGKPDAPITIMAFESLSCPHCASFHANTLPELKQKYVDTGKAKIVFVDFYIGPQAVFASMLARCTGNERHFAVLEMLFRSQQKWATARSKEQLFGELEKIGRLGGLSKAQFESCMNSSELYDGLRAKRAAAESKYGIRSTPTFVINGKKLIGSHPFSEFDKLMKPMLN